MYPAVVREARDFGSSDDQPYEELAAATGGRMFRASISQDLPIAEMMRDCQNYYVLSQDVPSDEKHLRWERVKVSASNKAAKVRAPVGFFVVPRDKKGN